MIALLSLLVLGSGATPPDLTETLKANRTELSVEDRRFNGAGAKVLAEAAEGAQYVFLGEDHGIAQVAQAADALYALLQPAGFDTLAVEVGPFVAEALNDTLRKPDALGAHTAFLRAHPMTVPFYGTAEEFDFVRHAAQQSGPAFSIIGFDQELMGAGRLLLEDVRRQALSLPLQARVDHLLALERAAEAEAVKSGNPTQLYLMSAPKAELTGLQTALREARLDAAPIDNLLASREVYEEWSKDGFNSNVIRSLLMRRYFTARQPAGSSRKVMLKAGANHAFKGLSAIKNRDLGNYIAEAAESAGRRSLHVLIVAKAGTQLMFAGAGRPLQPAPVDANKDSMLLSLKPLLDLVGEQKSWSLFDLRALRGRFDSYRVAIPDFEKVVFGFDLVIVIPKSMPSRELAPGHP